MAAVDQNFEMYAGDSKEINVQVTDSGNAKNIVGATIVWAMMNSPDNQNYIVKKSTDGGILITDGENGRFRISLDPADTEEVTGGFYHEAELTDSFGNVSTILVGNAVINPSGV